MFPTSMFPDFLEVLCSTNDTVVAVDFTTEVPKWNVASSENANPLRIPGQLRLLIAALTKS
jgi:hypothetical protein